MQSPPSVRVVIICMWESMVIQCMGDIVAMHWMVFLLSMWWMFVLYVATQIKDQYTLIEQSVHY